MMNINVEPVIINGDNNIVTINSAINNSTKVSIGRKAKTSTFYIPPDSDSESDAEAEAEEAKEVEEVIEQTKEFNTTTVKRSEDGLTETIESKTYTERYRKTTRTIVREELMIISEQQKTAAYNIIDQFSNGKRWCLLTAQMQSGKTTTYYLVAAEMLRLNSHCVDNIVIFSGNNETELKEQVTNKSRKDFFKAYRNYLKTEIRIKENERDAIMDYMDAHLRVLWGDDMKHYNSSPNKTLFIWDESHYAQNKTNRPHKFLDKIGITADGDLSLLNETNVFMLSVSATPFSEFSDNHHQNQQKAVVNLEVGDRYHGLEKMMQNNLIYGFNPTRWSENLLSIMERHKTDRPKYGLVRLRESKNVSFNIAKSLIIRSGWSCRVFDSTKDSDVNNMDVLKTEPENHTIILLRGKCRMGKVVPKQHIAFCMETSQNPNTDVILQGLLGRMCGYHDYGNVQIFISNKLYNGDELNKYIQYTHKEIMIPSRASNIICIRKQKCSLFPIIPIKISGYNFRDKSNDEIRHDVIAMINEIKYGCRNNVFNVQIENHNAEEQYEEVFNRLSNAQISDFEHVRDASCETYRGIRKVLKRMIQTKFPEKLGSSCGIEANSKKMVIWKLGRDLYIDAKTETGSRLQLETSSIPKTTKKETFCRIIIEDSDDECC